MKESRTEHPSPPTLERLQKILARAGVAARRKVEEMISQGRVTVNGQIAELGTKADPERDAIKVDGKRVQFSATVPVYLVLNKPKGVMSTVSDPEGRQTVLDFVPHIFRKALVPVGRLDFTTEGLLLLTNDGEFAQRVSHPRYGCTKTYEVKIAGRPEEKQLDKLRHGIVLEGRRTAPCVIESKRKPPNPRGAGRRTVGEKSSDKPSEETTWWRVILTEGRSRQIREMFSRIGHPVQKLRRIAIGPLFDPHLPLGALRELTAPEVDQLRKSSRRVKPVERPPAAAATRPRRTTPAAGEPSARPSAKARASSKPGDRAARPGVPGRSAAPSRAAGKPRPPRPSSSSRPVRRSPR